MWDLASLTFDSKGDTPSDGSEVELLSPPEEASLLSHDFESFVVDRSVLEPSKEVKSAWMFSGSKSSIVSEEAESISVCQYL